MPWKEQTVQASRAEFVHLVLQGGITMSEACRRAGIARKTGYKWLQRYLELAETGLEDHSRRPQHSPSRTDPAMEELVVKMRRECPAWGGRTIARRLQDMGHSGIPHPNTITDILRRHQALNPITAPSQPWQRFEYTQPNDLWQMDFKGYFPMVNGRCHPLSILDDYSRFSPALDACANQQAVTVRRQLVLVFERYGLPWRILVDNGPPWGQDREHPHTPLAVWLMRLGIRVMHGRPYHPQTQGKVERFHRTLTAELLRDRRFTDLPDCQRQFDRWRHRYNQERPHQALNLDTPISRYRPSERSFPSTLPPLQYGPDDQVRRVQDNGRISYRGKRFRVGKAFKDQPVAIRPTTTDGIMEVYFQTTRIKTLDLTT